jgi:hypothetical protein
MMRHRLLIVILALTGCVGRAPGHPEIGRMIEERLAPRQICVRLPDGGEWAVVRDDRVSLRGAPGPGGGFVYPDRMEDRRETIRAAFDLLAELGFYSVEEEDLPGPWRGRMRHYKATALAEAHIRLVPGGHGASGWYGLCYGQRKLVAIHRVGPVRYAPCRISREVRYTYQYVGIPAWADDPRLRRVFADIIGSAEAKEIRHNGDTLVRSGDAWFVEEKVYEPYYVPCINEGDPSFRTD